MVSVGRIACTGQSSAAHGAGQNHRYTRSNLSLLSECIAKLRTNSSQQKNGKMSDDIHQSPYVLFTFGFSLLCRLCCFFLCRHFQLYKKLMVFKFFKNRAIEIALLRYLLFVQNYYFTYLHKSLESVSIFF